MNHTESMTETKARIRQSCAASPRGEATAKSIHRRVLIVVALLVGVAMFGGRAVLHAQDSAGQGRGVDLRSAEELTAVDPDELLDMADETLFPESFRSTMRMTTERPGRRTTEMLMESSHLEGAGTFMEVLEPRRSRGMRFLQKEDDLWMYNPRSGSRRAIRLSPRDSFQGSVFSNNDVSDPDYSDDYTARHAGVEAIDHPQLGRVEAAVIEAVASHDESPYGRILMWLRPDEDGRIIPLRFDYYSRSGLLFKRMILDEIGPLAGAQRPKVMRMESLEEEGAVTTVRIEELEATDDMPERMFNQQELTR